MEAASQQAYDDQHGGEAMWDTPIGRMIVVILGLLAPLAVHTQPREALPQIGVLEPGPPPENPHGCLGAFQHGLRELGYVEGDNVVVDYRYAEFTPDRLALLGTDLVQRNPAVLWTHSNLAAWALKRVTTTITIVVAVSSQIVEQGLVESLAHPGGN